VGVVVKAAGAVIFEFISTIMDQVGNLSDLISAVFRGDFDAAAESAKRYFSRFGQAASHVAAEIKDAFVTAQDSFGGDLDRIWGAKVAATAAGPGKGTKRMGDLKDPKERAKEESALPKVDERLAAAKLRFAQENDLREMSKAEELATYQELLAQAQLTDKDKVTSARKTAEMKLGVLREERAQNIALSNEAIQQYKEQQLGLIEFDRQNAQQAADLGLITQEQLIQQELQMEERRYQIVKAAVQERLQVLASDPTKNVVALQKLNGELEAVEQEHMLKSKALMNANQKEQMKDWQGLFTNIGQSFGGVVQGLVNRTMTLGQAVKSLFSNLLGNVASFLGQIVAKKAAAWVTEKALTMAGIGADAAKAGSGAAASQASIPYVGPILAIAAMAAVFAAVMGMSSSVPSARSGFDIPAGINPLTQLHEKEMVLPEAQADAVRSMAGGQGGAPIIIPTTGGDFIHKDQLASLLKKLNRNFTFK